MQACQQAVRPLATKTDLVERIQLSDLDSKAKCPKYLAKKTQALGHAGVTTLSGVQCNIAADRLQSTDLTPAITKH